MTEIDRPCLQSKLILENKNAFEAGYKCECYRQDNNDWYWVGNPFEPDNTDYNDFAEGMYKRRAEARIENEFFRRGKTNG